MAKKKGALGKLIAFTTTVAAIGGVCYVFRDKIKDSPIFKSVSDKASDLYDTVKTKMNKDDDFLFDDDFLDNDNDSFDNSNESGNEREYTSISVSVNHNANAVGSDDNEESDQTDNSPSDSVADASDNIPTINFGSQSAGTSDTDNTEAPSAYENEGLSDVSEDPDVLEDMDKLDF